MEHRTVEFDQGEWVHSLAPEDLPEQFKFGLVDITDRAKFLQFFQKDMREGGSQRVSFGQGMLRDLYELAVVVMMHQSEGRLTTSPLMATPAVKPEVPSV